MPSREDSGISGGWWFLAVMLVVYAAIALYSIELALDCASFSLGLLYRLLPVIFIVFVLIFLLNIFFDKKQIEKWLGAQSGVKGWATAIITGVLSVGPIYAWYPLLKDFRSKGMAPSLIAAFLYSRAIKPPLAPLMIHYFGWSYTLIIYFYTLAFSVIGGILVEKLTISNTSHVSE